MANKQLALTFCCHLAIILNAALVLASPFASVFLLQGEDHHSGSGSKNNAASTQYLPLPYWNIELRDPKPVVSFGLTLKPMIQRYRKKFLFENGSMVFNRERGEYVEEAFGLYHLFRLEHLDENLHEKDRIFYVRKHLAFMLEFLLWHLDQRAQVSVKNGKPYGVAIREPDLTRLLNEVRKAPIIRDALVDHFQLLQPSGTEPLYWEETIDENVEIESRSYFVNIYDPSGSEGNASELAKILWGTGTTPDIGAPDGHEYFFVKAQIGASLEIDLDRENTEE